MKTWRLTAIVAMLALVIVSLSAFRAQTDTMTITVVERATTDVVTDIGAEGDSVGDILTFANEVFDEANENKIGTDQGYCFRVEVGKSWECNWTLFLEGGQITVEVPFFDTGDSVLAITGGTGDYADARGQMTLHFRNDPPTEFDFIYEISQ
jgi:hypothetical protein